jgi:hypothetical protein
MVIELWRGACTPQSWPPQPISFNARDSSKRVPGPEGQWQDKTLYSDFCDAMAPGDNIGWDINENLRLWSIGTFLETAQHHTAAALNKTMNAWLALKLKLKANEADNPWYQVWPGTRIMVLARFLEMDYETLNEEWSDESHPIRVLNSVYSEGANYELALVEGKQYPHLPQSAPKCVAKVTRDVLGRMVEPRSSAEEAVAVAWEKIRGRLGTHDTLLARTNC